MGEDGPRNGRDCNVEQESLHKSSRTLSIRALWMEMYMSVDSGRGGTYSSQGKSCGSAANATSY